MVDSIDEREDQLITFNGALDIGTKVALIITRDFLVSRCVDVPPNSANPWSQSPLPTIYLGTLDEVELNVGREADDRAMLDNAVYSIVLDVNVGVEEKLGVKVGYEDFAYKNTVKLEIGARCIAPLYNLEVNTQTMYTPKQCCCERHETWQ